MVFESACTSCFAIRSCYVNDCSSKMADDQIIQAQTWLHIFGTGDAVDGLLFVGISHPITGVRKGSALVS